MRLMLMLLLTLAWAPAWSQSAPLSVVASIPPIHSLVAGVTLGVTEPYLLVSGGASPHQYHLRPSEARAVEGADVIFWVGPELEMFLQKPLAAPGLRGQTVALGELPGLTQLSAREGGEWERRAKAHAHEEGENLDSHLWLDPRNAQAIVTTVAATLADLDPANAEAYRANRERMVQRLQALEKRLEAQLTAVTDVPFVVFHDAYQYFEARFGLNAVGSIAVSAERRPGAKRLSEIRAKVKATNARCVFSEPQFNAALVDAVLEDTQARSAVLDPLGAELEPGAELYFTLMEELGNSFASCLE